MEFFILLFLSTGIGVFVLWLFLETDLFKKSKSTNSKKIKNQKLIFFILVLLIILVGGLFSYIEYKSIMSATSTVSYEKRIQENISRQQKLNCVEEIRSAFFSYYDQRGKVLNSYDGQIVLNGNKTADYDKAQLNIFLAFDDYIYNHSRAKVDIDNYLSYSYTKLTSAKNILNTIRVENYEYINTEHLQIQKDALEKVFEGMRGLRFEYNKEPKKINTGRYLDHLELIEEAWEEMLSYDICGDL